jgi:nucleotide-binding universal stress UspA family protein
MSVILVGVDDSPAAADAVRWAAQEATLRGAPLHILHAWDLPRFAGWEDAPVTREGLQAESKRILDRLTSRRPRAGRASRSSGSRSGARRRRS